ncbi:RWD domain-containing protein 1 [Rhizophlyctis rosea]|uniref:RWD domain-containing protein 1 n=1 Tax=Rhizophlyctis rosea TaxID=64517 RepID=A0AAD5X1E5_9FUNG|nr:RWD domain-containing protein 1 [Rhizophlyctis rosea]
MTDYLEEQTNELEALRSIFPDEFEELDPGPPASFRINITLDPDTLPPSLSESFPFPPTLHLDITYTPTYPDEPPELNLSDVTGLDNTEQSSLLTELQETAQTLLGMAMIFSLASQARDSFDQILNDRSDRLAAEEEARILAEEEAERNRHIGTKVTPDSFAVWKNSFIAETAQILKSGGKLSSSQTAAAALAGLLTPGGKAGKLTGRQLFEKDTSLVKSDMAYVEEGDVAVDVDLFDEMDGLESGDEEEDEGEWRKNFTEDD